mgnify:CR=1 FL=1|jgi:hypothetical protein
MADRFKPGDPVYVYPEGGGSFRAEVVKVPACVGDEWIFRQIFHHQQDRLVYIQRYHKIEART